MMIDSIVVCSKSGMSVSSHYRLYAINASWIELDKIRILGGFNHAYHRFAVTLIPEGW